MDSPVHCGHIWSSPAVDRTAQALRSIAPGLSEATGTIRHAIAPGVRNRHAAHSYREELGRPAGAPTGPRFPCSSLSATGRQRAGHRSEITSTRHTARPPTTS
jgi:hypothetical protein